ncbi:hypothetical protein K525DRAFT_272592 [Schizophyllum commune Loenen D]|nr:hypothetical protein K525DRAFT_272592 [Schizophyllum commune Loenen D]
MAAHKIYDFDNIAPWDAAEAQGPANKAPAEIRALSTDFLRVDWMDISLPKEKAYRKNHMVFAALLTTPATIGGVTYFAARLSMELNDKADADYKIPDILICYDDYGAGAYTMKLLKYAAPSDNAPHSRTYSLKAGATVGELVDAVVNQRMHRFLFFSYTEDELWKGCGHHLLRVYTLYVDMGIIDNENSQEDPDTRLDHELLATYLKSGGKTHARVGRGRFLSWDDAEHRLVDETIWSVAPPRHEDKLKRYGLYP